ncbi:hypothetical protein [Brevibacterium ihuae]|uniref:hypothetical protein n=1 Tax=Brevibacterium ihuae TaxID=1631743 RepID=UPI000C78583D|nr:hypothetical protein [Brevibacterium ihuae]
MSAQRKSGRRRHRDHPADPAGRQPAGSVPADPQSTDEAAGARRFPAPLIAGALALLAVIALVVVSVVRQPEPLTVDALESPVVGALGAGEGIYPANSAEAITENVKFGYLPAVDIAALSDGTIVVADPETGHEELGLDRPLAEVDAATFADARVRPAPLTAFDDAGNGGGAESAETTREGTPITWEDALEEFGDETVLMPEIVVADHVPAVLDPVQEAGRTDGVIVRSSDLGVLEAAVGRDATALYSGDPSGTSPEELLAAGITMAALPADDPALDDWLGSDVRVWVTGVESEDALADLAERGAFGALAANPFAIQPSNVRTD